MSIKVDNLCLDYGRHTALDHLSFEINDAKIYGLLGRNGAGKTSLLSVIASMQRQTSGTVEVFGKSPFENDEVMAQVAFMYNKNYSSESSHAMSMLEDAARYRANFDMAYAVYLLERFKLDPKKPVKQFSKGMQSALNVTIGLAARAPVTILDEVYLGMDAPSRDLFYKELLKDYAEHPRMMILSTHLVSEMDHLFDEVIIIDNGKLLLHDTYDALVSKGTVITGNAGVVDAFVQSKQVINTQMMGNIKSVTVFEELPKDEREAALAQGLDLAPASLHDLFVRLTGEG